MANKDMLLSVKNLSVEYTSEGEVIHAVNNVSFELEKGKTIGLVGETGAGKTSIARAILRILPPGRSSASCRSRPPACPTAKSSLRARTC